MPFTGYIESASVTESSDGDLPWTNLANSRTFDAAYATAVLSGMRTNSLKYVFNFAAYIPAGSTITQVRMRVRYTTISGLDLQFNYIDLYNGDRDTGGTQLGNSTFSDSADATSPAWNEDIQFGTTCNCITGPNPITTAIARSGSLNCNVQVEDIAAGDTISIDTLQLGIDFTPPPSRGFRSMSRGRDRLGR